MTFETLIGTIRMRLCANVNPHPIYFLLFLSASCLLQNLMLECLHCSLTAGSLYDGK